VNRASLCILTLIVVTGCGRHAKTWPSVPIAPSPTPDKEFNLVWSKTDLNGLPYNPKWGLQESSNAEPPAQSPGACIREPYGPTCTIQSVLLDRPNFPNNLICVPFIPQSHVHGHVDWMPVEFMGLGAWLNFADDWDYNLMLLPTDDSGGQISNGFTTNNNMLGHSQYMEIEFASEETVDNFVTPWWKHFRTVVATLDKKATEHELYPANDETLPRTVAVGLFGLDCEHDCRSEIHPVYALAVEVSEDPTDNVWALFVRNWGTGGFCSSLNHEIQLPNNTLNILLPRRSHGTVEVDSQKTQFAGTGTMQFPDVAQIVGEGTVLTFHLPDPGQRSVTEMLLHLKWRNDDVRARLAAPLTFSTVASAMPTEEKAAENETSEGYLGALLAAKTGSRLSIAAFNALPPAAVPHSVIQPVPIVKVSVYEPSKSSTPTPLPNMKNEEDAAKSARDSTRILTVCRAYDNSPPTDKIPNFPQICQQLRTNSEAPLK